MNTILDLTREEKVNRIEIRVDRDENNEDCESVYKKAVNSSSNDEETAERMRRSEEELIQFNWNKTIRSGVSL